MRASESDPMYGRARIDRDGGRLVLRFEPSPTFVADLELALGYVRARWRDRTIPDAYVTFTLTPQGAVCRFAMAAVSPLADSASTTKI